MNAKEFIEQNKDKFHSLDPDYLEGYEEEHLYAAMEDYATLREQEAWGVARETRFVYNDKEENENEVWNYDTYNDWKEATK